MKRAMIVLVVLGALAALAAPAEAQSCTPRSTFTGAEWACALWCEDVAQSCCSQVHSTNWTWDTSTGRCSCAPICAGGGGSGSGGGTFNCTYDWECLPEGPTCACVITPVGSDCECGGWGPPSSLPTITDFLRSGTAGTECAVGM